MRYNAPFVLTLPMLAVPTLAWMAASVLQVSAQSTPAHSAPMAATAPTVVPMLVTYSGTFHSSR